MRTKRPKEIVVCGTCGKEFEVIAGNPKNKKWCSIQCAYQGIKQRTRDNGADMPCLHCGKVRFVAKSRIDKGREKFCSVACSRAYQKHQSELRRYTRVCETCGKVFKVNPGAFSNSHVWKYCSTDCFKEARANNARKKDGQKLISQAGYVEVYMYDHPKIKNNRTKRVGEHRLVMEEALGRPLEKWEHVHHKNGIRKDNRLENLELWVSGNHPHGHRVKDVYCADLEVVALENKRLKDKIRKLEEELSLYKHPGVVDIPGNLAGNAKQEMNYGQIQ